MPNRFSQFFQNYTITFVLIVYPYQFPELSEKILLPYNTIPEGFLLGLNFELHRFMAFLKFENPAQPLIEDVGKIFSLSLTFRVSSIENRYKKGSLQIFTTPNFHKLHDTM